MELKNECNDNVLILVYYVDSVWASDVTDRKSTPGWQVKIFENTVAWSSRNQNCIALSSTDAEIIALCSGVQDAIRLRKLLTDMKIINYSFKIPI